MIDTKKVQQVYADKLKAEQSKVDSAKGAVSHNDLLSGNDRIQRVIIAAAKAQIEAHTVHEPNVTVKNFPTSLKTPDIKPVIAELKKLSKDLAPVAVDFAPVIKALKSLESKISQLPTQFPETPEPIEEVTVKNMESMKPYFTSLEKTIKALKVDPQVTVDVKPDPTDLSPLLEAVTNLKVEEKLEFEAYKAQDLSEQVDGVQYLGMLNPEGGWFIIQNDPGNSTLRYKFGTSGYLTNFDNAMKHNYLLLDEAMREISA